MENLMPPPNGSPEEIQAWNSMMDTMVTFIKASTHLMNTITKKVRYSPPSAASGKSFDVMGGCEPECEACQPKPPCGICGKDVPAAAPKSPPAPSKAPSSKVQVIVTPPTPEPPQPAADENAEGGEEAEGGDAVEGGGAAEGGEAGEGGEVAPEGAEAPAAEPSITKPPSAAPLESPAAPAAPAVSQAAGDKQCTCAAIRAQRLKDQKRGQVFAASICHIVLLYLVAISFTAGYF